MGLALGKKLQKKFKPSSETEKQAQNSLLFNNFSTYNERSVSTANVIFILQIIAERFFDKSSHFHCI